MRKPRISKRIARALLVVVAVPASAVSCGGAAGSQTAFFGRLEGVNEIFFAHETVPACQLEASNGDKQPTQEAQWVKVPPNALTNRQFTVVQRSAEADPAGTPYRSIELREASGTTMWIRNTPSTVAQQTEDRWSCAIPGKDVQALSFDLRATAVQLLPYGPRCHGITPVTGGADDVRFAPYALIARRLFVGTDKKPVLGITLASPGAERLVTVTATDLQNCFGAVTPSVLPADETSAFLKWLTTPLPDSKPTPPVSFGVVMAYTGVDPAGCIRDGSGATGHVECRQPLFGVLPTAEPGLYGSPPLLFTNQRVVDALHGYGDKLVSGGEVVTENVVVRAPKVKNAGFSFGRFFNTALGEAVLSSEKQLARGARGVRILRPSDVTAGVVATHYLDVEATYTATEAQQSTEKRTVKNPGGTKQGPNPDLGRLRGAAEEARRESALATKDGLSMRQLGTVNAPACSGAAPICNYVATGLGDFAGAHERAAATRAQTAEDLTRAAPENVAVDDMVDSIARIFHRRGEAQVQLKLTPVDVKDLTPPAVFAIRVPFEAIDAEVASDPAHKVVAKTAHPPSQDEVEKALAEALVPRIDQLLGDYAERRKTGVDPAALQPGTRAWMAGAARHAAGDRPVKLFGDVMENRDEMLKKGSMTYPVKIPSDGEQRCFTFVSAPVEGFGDVNLAFGYEAQGRFMTLANDARHAPVAAFELCHPRTGDYVLAISWPADVVTKGVIISMFDSTPGNVSDTDARAAREGTPTLLH